MLVYEITTATALAEHMRASTGAPVAVAEADPADHDVLVEQYRAERY